METTKLSLTETKKLLSDIDFIGQTNINLEPLKGVVIDIYENYKFTKNEFEKLVSDIMSYPIASCESDSEIMAGKYHTIEAFKNAHEYSAGINRFIPYEQRTQFYVVDELHEEEKKNTGINTITADRKHELWKEADKVADDRIKEHATNVVSDEYKHKLKAEAGCVQAKKNIENTEKLTKSITNMVSGMIEDADKELSGAIATAMVELVAENMDKVSEVYLKDSIESGTPFGDMFKVLKEKYYNGTPEQKKRFQEEVIGGLMKVISSQELNPSDSDTDFTDTFMDTCESIFTGVKDDLKKAMNPKKESSETVTAEVLNTDNKVVDTSTVRIEDSKKLEKTEESKKDESKIIRRNKSTVTNSAQNTEVKPPEKVDKNKLEASKNCANTTTTTTEKKDDNSDNLRPMIHIDPTHKNYWFHMVNNYTVNPNIFYELVNGSNFTKEHADRITEMVGSVINYYSSKGIFGGLNSNFKLLLTIDPAKMDMIEATMFDIELNQLRSDIAIIQILDPFGNPRMGCYHNEVYIG